MNNIKIITKFLKDNNSDAYLVYDFRGSNFVGRQALGINPHTTRRWVGFVKADGSIIYVIPRIEITQFEDVDAKKFLYSSYQEFNDILKNQISSFKKLNAEISENNEIAVSDIVPSGFVQLLRSFNPNLIIESSANLTSQIAATWKDVGLQTHLEASKDITEIKDLAFNFVKKSLSENKIITDYDVRLLIIEEFKKRNLYTEEDICIVSTNERTGDAHYFPTKEKNHVIEKNSVLLLDIWAKKNIDGAVYSDSTFMAWIGPDKVPFHVEEIWDIVSTARDIGINMVLKNSEAGLMGFKIDKKVREFIVSKGYGDNFIHRTGHSIDTNDHGSGADIDNFEKKDTRKLIPDSGFSIEPGIYLKEFGIRSEVNMYIDKNGKASVTTFLQKELKVI